MIIREIQPKDNEAIKKVIQRSLEKLGLNVPGTAYFDPQLSDLYTYYANLKHAKYWIVEMENTVVGGIGIAPFDKEHAICELQKLYLAETVKGIGLGGKLVEVALSFAEEHYEQCYLETMHELKTACILYEKYGFDLLNKPLSGSEHSTMDAWYIKRLKVRDLLEEAK
ncbi:GNAT family N-acetyltransferase [Sporosarcina sp. Sa2YVA2]|uniref:GNAT family N-acetyltransferase n=1 Tax=Sporosarcina quadrami TaxID=2762234 RepID=A0ABR8UCI9_9BACL|nr:GNAT family N-acetyltransferase [Sporosarcina quadrami]MBD7985736.1 GNAT family N-acetyltransferase [Sporosarcina quadrami]